jgi:hypothetical protein
VSNGRRPEPDEGRHRPPWDGRLTSRLRWTTLIAAVAAVTVLVPPLVAPKTQARSAAQPAPSASHSSSSSASAHPTASASAAGPSFATISLQASDPGNIRKGAHVFTCATCDGGDRVGYLGGANYLIIPVRGVPAAGTRTLTVVYENDGRRTLMISVNGITVSTLSLTGGSWHVPATTTLPVFLPAGASMIKFFNDSGPAPDINRIVIS